jgi:putative intracellular protease/amidase
MTSGRRSDMVKEKKRILMVVANPSVSTTTGWPVGFWASELTHAYDAFVKRGYEVVVASPDGGKVEVDALSDPRDPSGYSRDDGLSLAYLSDPGFAALLQTTPGVRQLEAADFDAIVVAGGQSPMFTFQGATVLQELFARFHRAGKVSAALCHGVSLLLHLKTEDGRPFVAGKRLTGFADSEEDFADQAVGRKLMPFRIEDEARRLGAEFIAAPAFQPHAVRDGNLITGQQQHSGAETARLVIEALEEGGN